MKAVIIGATGLTGNALLLKLLTKDQFPDITCFVRTIPDDRQKSTNYIQTDFDMIDPIEDLINGQVFAGKYFSPPGTQN